MQLQTIAFFNWLYPYGGAETVTHNLASFFHKQGYRIILYIEKLNRELLCDEERAIFQFRELPAGPDPIRKNRRTSISFAGLSKRRA